jgi:hypothetical protein
MDQWNTEAYFVWWDRITAPEPEPAAPPSPAPRRAVPTRPRELRGLDTMKSLFASVGRQHLHHRR